MNTKNLKYYLGVCEEGSISKAATKMFISPQGMSRIITALEEELGCSLMLRSATGIQLTPSGRILENYARQIMQTLDEMQHAMGTMEEEQRHPLWLACSYSVLDYLPRSLLNQFRVQNANVDLMISEYPYSLVDKLLLEGKFDFGLGYSPIDTKRFDYILVDRLKWPILIHRDNPLSQKKNIVFQDLLGQDFYLPNSNYRGRQIILDRCNELQLFPHIAGTINDLSESHQVVKEKKGITVSIQGVENRVVDPVVTTVYLDDDKCVSDLLLYYPKYTRFSSTAERFYYFMKEYARSLTAESST